MKVFTAAQIKAWDAFTIAEQGISSEILMERAAAKCYEWLVSNHFTNQPTHIFCGKGNNGGDGLAIARMMLRNHKEIQVYIIETGKTGSDDFQKNLAKLHPLTTNIHFIQSDKFFPSIEEGDLVIDALFGTGLTKPLDGFTAQLVEYLNAKHNTIISIDLPSGLFSDTSSLNQPIITATHSLSFQMIKLAFLMPENDKHAGRIHILDIGLSKNFELAEPALYEITSLSLIRSIIRPRNKFSHKGTYGHAALICGSEGMMGAAVLSARGCLQAGVGKLTCFIPSVGYEILQVSVPEAMCKMAGEKFISSIDEISGYDAVGIGPGIGTNTATAETIQKLLSANKVLVLDADCLNICAANNLIDLIPTGSVITPHPKEFEKLFGNANNDFHRLELAIENASALNIYIVLKGHYTAIITPKRRVYFNDTGNAGMAKAGMGDILTGIVTGLVCQGYPLPEAAIIAVYLHGLAGDIAAEKFSLESMQATDLIENIGNAWHHLWK